MRFEIIVELLLQIACLLTCYVVSVRRRLCIFLTIVFSGRRAQKFFATQIQDCKYLETRIGFNCTRSRSQWPRGLRCRSAAARLLESWVRIPPGAWTFVCCDCCVLSGRGLCDEMATRPEASYRLWCVVVCNVETS